MTKGDFLYHLTHSKAALKTITLIPGETYYFFLQDIAKTLHISVFKLFSQYANQAYKKDGNIIANTYSLPLGMKENELIGYLLNVSNKRYQHFSKKIFGFYDKKRWYRYVTIASIIQKEAASKQEMPLIASVIYNRLEKNMKLQMDGTLNYGKYSHTIVTPKMIRENRTSYNTYKNKGIPTDPVCAIEMEALKAAIFPAKTDYLYFVKSIDGKKHIFRNSFKKHKKYIKKIKKYKKKKTRKQKFTKSIKRKKIHYKKPHISKKNRLKTLWK